MKFRESLAMSRQIFFVQIGGFDTHSGQITGQNNLLTQVSRGHADLDDLDLNPLLISVDWSNRITYDRSKPRNAVPDTLDAEIIKDGHRFFEDGEKM